MKSPIYKDATIVGMKVSSQAHPRRWGFLLYLAAGYLLVFPPLELAFGAALTTLLALPVAVVTWYFGLTGGLIASLLGVLFNISFLVIVEKFDLNMLLFFGLIPRPLMLIAMVFGIHLLRKQMDKYASSGLESQSREQYLTLLNDMTRAILLSGDIDSTLSELAGDMAKLINADDCYITRWDEEKQMTIPTATTATLETPYSTNRASANTLTMTASVLKAGRVLAADDVLNSPYINIEIAKRYPARSVIGVPLIARDHKLGAAIIAFNSPHHFTSQEIERAEHAANHIAVALWNAQQDFEIKKRLQESDAFAKIAIALSETERIGLSNVLKLILDFSKELIPGTEQAVIHLLDEEKNFLNPNALIGYGYSEEGNKRMRLGEGIAGQAVASGESISIADVDTDPRFIKLNSKSKIHSLIVAPIKSGLEILGTISVQSNIPNVFTQHEKSLLSKLGTQAAIAIENARLYDAAQSEIAERKKAEQALRESIETEREQRLNAETSAEATLALVSHTDQTEVLSEILSQLQRLVPDCSINISLVDQDNHLRTAIWRGYEGKGNEIFSNHIQVIDKFPLAAEMLKTRRTLIVNDTQKEAQWVSMAATAWIRSHIAIPLFWQEQLLGILHLDGDQPGMFNEQTVVRLTPLINAATVALESALLLENTQQALKETNALYRINQGLVALNADDLLEDVVDLLQKNFGYYHVQVYVVDPETGGFVVRAGSGEIGRKLKTQNFKLSEGAGIVGYTAETSVPFFTNNVDEVVFFIRNPLLPETKSELAVPVKNGDQILGVLDIQQAPPKTFLARDLQLVVAVADQLAIALQKANLYKDLQTSLQHEKAARNQLIQSERLAIMGRLLASVSHELNNPLQAIQNALFLIKEEKGISDQGLQDLEIVLAESERMANMIERLRTTYRPIQIEDFQPTQINSVVEDVYALTATHLKNKKITFDFQPDPEVPVIPALSDQIRQVTLNLLMNGAEAMSGGGVLTVSTHFVKDKDEVLVTVSDTGIGIDPSILPNIFDAFTTNKQRGTGLGLAISHDIVIKHDGRITAENNPECGATFKVWLPAKHRESA